MSLSALSELDDEVPIFPESPDSLRSRAPSTALHEQLNSTSNDHAPSTDTEDEFLAHDKLLKQCTSGRSSISSFPGSVIHTIPFTDTEDVGLRTPLRSRTFEHANKPSTNSYLSVFRHPSSVRALQLESEYADSDASSIRHIRPKKSPKISHFSTRSPGSVHSSPTKRSSRPGTPRQQSGSKLKKEFPLVLLHCSLLPPALVARGPPVADDILEAVLPEEFRKRWKTLQEKVAKNSEIRQRGVLIPHPRDDYELLEERLLETLELERPRIRKGHYLGSKTSVGSDSGFESSSQNGTDEGSDEEGEPQGDLGDKCPDCGHAVSCETEQTRNWEVKVFAANGLMKGGAWAAAWEEMEKVDVEVGMWMPEDVRVEVEERLKALQAKEEAERPVDESTQTKTRSKRTRSNTAKLRHDERMREIYGDIGRTTLGEDVEHTTEHESIPLSAEPSIESTPVDGVQKANLCTETPEEIQNHQTLQGAVTQEDFILFARRQLNSLWNDQRNLAIILLSILVLFFSIQNANSTFSTQPSRSDGKQVSATSQLTTSEDVASVSYLTTTVYANPSALPSVEMDVDKSSSSENGWHDTIIDEARVSSTSAESSTASNIGNLREGPEIAPELTDHYFPQEKKPNNGNEHSSLTAASDVSDILAAPGNEIFGIPSEPTTKAELSDVQPKSQTRRESFALSVGDSTSDDIETILEHSDVISTADPWAESPVMIADQHLADDNLVAVENEARSSDSIYENEEASDETEEFSQDSA